jgi:hypothetical protein
MMAECGAKCQPRGLIVILVPFTRAGGSVFIRGAKGSVLSGVDRW